MCLAREGLGFETPIGSDCASVLPVVRALHEAGIAPRCLRDCTRGGLAAAVSEIALAAKVDVHMREASIPVVGPVRAATEILGLDPVHLACEGRLVAFVSAEHAAKAEAAEAEVLADLVAHEATERAHRVVAQGLVVAVVRVGRLRRRRRGLRRGRVFDRSILRADDLAYLLASWLDTSTFWSAARSSSTGRGVPPRSRTSRSKATRSSSNAPRISSCTNG